MKSPGRRRDRERCTICRRGEEWGRNRSPICPRVWDWRRDRGHWLVRPVVNFCVQAELMPRVRRENFGGWACVSPLSEIVVQGAECGADSVVVFFVAGGAVEDDGGGELALWIG